MASTTIASLSTVLKEVYTSETLKKQFYDDNPVLEKIKQVTGTVIGRQASVPIQTQSNGGYTSVGPVGGSLNPAGTPAVTTGVYTLVGHWHQIAIEDAVLNQGNGGSASVMDAVTFIMDDAISAMSRQISRQLVNDGSGFIAQCGATSASTTVVLQPTASGGRGAQAIVRNHLRVGLPIDIGTLADSDAVAAGLFITDVDSVNQTITVSSAVTTTTSHYISIANPNSTVAPNVELNGFRNIAGSTTAPLGGIDPATAGNSFWKPAYVDNTSQAWSIATGMTLNQNVQQVTGKIDTQIFTSVKQAANMYKTLQNQVRFAGEMSMGAGGTGGLIGVNWNGQGINVMPDIYDTDWFAVNLADLIRVTGQMKDPTWVSETEGRGKHLGWQAGTTGFYDAIRWWFQIGASRRNSHGALTNLQ